MDERNREKEASLAQFEAQEIEQAALRTGSESSFTCLAVTVSPLTR